MQLSHFTGPYTEFNDGLVLKTLGFRQMGLLVKGMTVA